MRAEECFRYAPFARRLLFVSPASGERKFIQVSSAEYWKEYGPDRADPYSIVDEYGRFYAAPTADEIQRYAIGWGDFTPYPDPLEYILDIRRRYEPVEFGQQMRQLRRKRWQF
jgi:hypothetical protein